MSSPSHLYSKNGHVYYHAPSAIMPLGHPGMLNSYMGAQFAAFSHQLPLPYYLHPQPYPFAFQPLPGYAPMQTGPLHYSERLPPPLPPQTDAPPPQKN
jgi:hypothetical protein